MSPYNVLKERNGSAVPHPDPFRPPDPIPHEPDAVREPPRPYDPPVEEPGTPDEREARRGQPSVQFDYRLAEGSDVERSTDRVPRRSIPWAVLALVVGMIGAVSMIFVLLASTPT